MSAPPLDEVRVGIIGPSWWVDYWHLAAIKNHPAAEIHAVCGSADRAPGDVTGKYGVQARYFTNYEQMLDSVSLDGVIVCTPNDTHYPATMAALRRGVHVTCEKPLAMNAGQAQEMADAARKRGLIGMTNFPYRDNPAVKEMRARIAAGHVGRVLHVSGQYHGGFGLRRSPNWRAFKDRSGAGILGDLGSHLIDLARFVTGDEFGSVCSHLLTVLHGESGIEALIRTEDPRAGRRNDDSCSFISEFRSGAQGVFHTSWVAYQGAYRQHQDVEVYGSEGRIQFIANHSGTLVRAMRNDDEQRWVTLAVDDITLPEDGREEEDWFRPGRHTETNTTYRWIEAIRTGMKSVEPSLDDGFRTQQVIDAVLRASAERRWIDVSA
ncbi:MAG TPA: Gfo/Idh/MocA family oxidoreductase [Chthonomonadaceae bacterium]|nr:Gfo/Idh/MocA family oxidoreductase [Chthonomonadaceae bacterium]